MNKFLKNNLIAGFDSVSLFHNESFESQTKEALLWAKLRANETGVTVNSAIKKNFQERLIGQIMFVTIFMISLGSVLVMAEQNINEWIILSFWITLMVSFVLFKIKIKKSFNN